MKKLLSDFEDAGEAFEFFWRELGSRHGEDERTVGSLADFLRLVRRDLSVAGKEVDLF